jgi:hypothetical protein
MTTNGTFPLTPPPIPDPRPPTRHLVVELRDADAPDLVLDTEELSDAELLAECQRRGFLSTTEGGWMTRVERPDITVEGDAETGQPGRTMDELFGSAADEVIGATPSGEAVRMVDPPFVAQGKPSDKVPLCGRPIDKHPGLRCALPAGHGADDFCDGKIEEPVRMVGAERAATEAGRREGKMLSASYFGDNFAKCERCGEKHRKDTFHVCADTAAAEWARQDVESVPAGKMPSQWIREWATAHFGASFGNESLRQDAEIAGIVAYLNEKATKGPT